MNIDTRILNRILANWIQKSSLNVHHKKSTNKFWKECGEKCWWECKLVQPLWRTVWRFVKKLKIELPYDPAIPLLGIYLRKNMVWKDTCIPMFIAMLFTIAKTWKQPKCSSANEWIQNTGTYIQWNITQPLKKNEIMPYAATWMDLEIIILSEVSQTQKDQYHMISLICGI